MQMMRLTSLVLLLGLANAAAHGKQSGAKSLHGRELLQTLSKPIGEGAYQSHEAVKDRTTDKNTHCEDQKWGDCYKHDYIDKRGSPPKPAALPKKSGCPRAPIVGVF